MKTVKVKILVTVDIDGKWDFYGGCHHSDKDVIDESSEFIDPFDARYWLEAELELPKEPPTIIAEVTKA